MTDLVHVVGAHRSGTSVIHRWLGFADGITRLVNTGAPEDEGVFCHDVWDASSEAAGPGTFANDPANHWTHADPDAGERMLEGWARFWEHPGAPIRIEKSPAHSTRTRWLQGSLEPHVDRVRFIIIIRHPIPVAESTWGVHRAWDGNPDHHDLFRHWLRLYGILARDMWWLHDFCVLRYEDLVFDFEATRRRLGAWLGADLPELEVQPRFTIKYEQVIDRYRGMHEATECTRFGYNPWQITPTGSL